ncbi:uncharacterized protein Z518_06807 [Rhinocladiella mackenziei CBS 650.93]|uniref:Pathogenesis associated protein Cap20 n=1 Tax=Rhinocladiella mackenziei CBS 650.93 TaxID=1442369 RepID=A0A0D2J2S1_9EURO|nr:uncharacterized protein Z518_06807 [Rhinocladiella mackenziei CBS 650.93]KIX03255.1 hypothetical protein Z518_06807 [Rhinocladiella mackenziei CBS 650.93]
MGETTVNGDKPHSAFLSVGVQAHFALPVLPAFSCPIDVITDHDFFFQHLASYPIVSDSITTIKGNPYGAKSIDLTNAGYVKFVKPTLHYFETPTAYAKPYVTKADELGDQFLTKFDKKVPIVKSETKEIQSTIMNYLNWPLETAHTTKDWALSTYNEEYKKCGGEGYVAGGKAVITTSLIMSSDILKYISAVLRSKKEGAKEAVQEKTSK